MSFHLFAAHNAQLLPGPSIPLSEELTREQAFLAQGRPDGAPQVLHPVWPAKRQRETRIDEIARGQNDILEPGTNWGQAILEVRWDARHEPADRLGFSIDGMNLPAALKELKRIPACATPKIDGGSGRPSPEL